MTDARILALIDDLRNLSVETSWVEFKENNFDPQRIGKLLSALSNAARLAGQHFAYILWGVRDADHSITGTTFIPEKQMQQGQLLEFWLAQRLQPGVAFVFKPIDYQGERLVLLEIPAAATSPVEFERMAYIRIGSTTPRLSDHPEHLKALWTKLQTCAWETEIAARFLTGDKVLDRLDYVSYFDLTGQPLPDNRSGIFDRLVTDRLVQKDVGGHWNITNLGAILFAKRLDDFSPSMARKAVRFVAYDGLNRADTVRHRQDMSKGYASGFEGLINYIDGLLPHNEQIGTALREEKSLYPAIALRELIANALIHQDMTITGTGPLIEMFKDRLEMSNPGKPLVTPERFLDSPPRSRNEVLASLMRRMRLCEEQGTGIDKVIVAVEQYQSPPPDFRIEGDAVRVVLFAPRCFAEMTPQERVRACYQHAALKYVSGGQRMKNATLCARFGISSHNRAQASVVIRQTLDAELIKLADSGRPKAGYVPAWA